MQNPLQTPSGNCYDRQSLAAYVKKSGPKDPIGFRHFGSIDNCAENKALQFAIRDFFKKNPNLMETGRPLSDSMSEFEL
jgi:hypothetical protein